ncbi:amidohydrolase [Streptomyces cavernicola]|uniref:Amidohydrolase n=1 Tax=Streptomyces cavernicola TaxID=3043613 RepID=A0ABT6S6X6_9ACTN|nr:amidohydrolase [Streptomyces sp. B-S-A6]MDI3403193.1 amidohydrolase [Streptomyces sp. B-S-A6]
MRLDALFTGGRFTTMDPDRPTAHSLGVVAGVIVGFDEELAGCRADRVHDLAGAPVVPGFHDAHHHLGPRGLEMRMCDVSPAAVRDLDGLYAAVARHADRLAPDAWVLAVNYDDDKLGGPITREGLDKAAGGRPAWVLHCSHHSGVVNTEAIRRMGYENPADLPDGEGCWVERRPDGEPTGVIAERSLDLVHRLIRPAPFDAFLDALELGGRAALADGLTSVTEPGIAGSLTGNGPQDLAAYLTAVDQDRMGVRMTVMPEASVLHPLGDPASGESHQLLPQQGPFGLDLGLRTGLGDDRLRIGGVKIFSDGALTARTAAMCEHYVDEPGQRGLLHEDAENLRQRILQAHLAGWQVATHAIGDRAVQTVLDAYEHAQSVLPRPDVRHRIEHFGVADHRQVEQVLRLGVVPVPQGRFLSELGDVYVRNIGPERGRNLYRQRSLLDAGIEVPGSSDCPVVSGSPLLGIQALVSRVLPDGSVLSPAECLTPYQALRAYTHGSAYADHQEHRKGSLSRGKLADFTVLSDDLLAVAPQRIGELVVLATVVGGVVRHGTDVLPPA